MQWTGGRAGGHHSFEDFHQPILATYSSIRRHDNIALVARSGFGGSDDTWPYPTGDWSKQFGVEPMPFDGFLFASRVVDLIVAAAGVYDSQWEGTYVTGYVKDSGGIITVRSELGEPIHKVNNQTPKLWKEHDDTVFKLPREKRAAWLQEHRAEPWFPAKKDGRVVEDLGDMTYEETVLRLVRSIYVTHEDRRLDLSLRSLAGDWLRRVEERFAGVNGSGPKASKLQSYSNLDEPSAFITSFFEKYPLATKQLLAHEDKWCSELECWFLVDGIKLGFVGAKKRPAKALAQQRHQGPDVLSWWEPIPGEVDDGEFDSDNVRSGIAPSLQPCNRCLHQTRVRWPHESGYYMRETRRLRKDRTRRKTLSPPTHLESVKVESPKDSAWGGGGAC
ncbi:hypothetical protein BGY98DRAFT_1174608 [Russula aff. rugulosa BPL654]|nr:hypothetical protein BGY98DRAFT_1174608 [Russula aff. rugulosa BPL654]